MASSIHDELIRNLLERRGITEKEAQEAFLCPSYERDIRPSQALPGVERAAARILSAIERGERIAIYADFDCDGIPGAVVLHDFFRKVGHEHIEVYIPHRDREGYGFHACALEGLSRAGVSLIITVDVGTTALEACARAKELGMDVIVTDHHEPHGPLPEAVAIVNPMLAKDAAEPNVCGAAVAWKLVCATLEAGRARGLGSFEAIPLGWEKWLLDMVALATVADLMPLVGENRALVHFGLTVLRKSRRTGIRALAMRARIRQNELSEEDIAFALAPRINAASRMDNPELAFRLLTAGFEEAEALAERLEELNASRKASVGALVREAKKRAKQRFASGVPVVMGDTAWKPALLGLAANALMEERGGLVCLWGRDASGNLKGSCRSDGSVSVVELFSHASAGLEAYGGHAHSGGFSVSHERVHALPDSFAEAALALEKAPIAREPQTSEGVLGLSEVTQGLFSALGQLAPFGLGNPKPVFRIPRVRIDDVKRFGREKNHTELSLCNENGFSCRAFQFFRAPADFALEPVPGVTADILATVERDSYRGGIALRVVDVASAL